MKMKILERIFIFSVENTPKNESEFNFTLIAVDSTTLGTNSNFTLNSKFDSFHSLTMCKNYTQ